MAAVLPFIGLGLSAGSQVIGGMAESRAARYRQQVAEMNRKIAEDNARRAIEKSQIDAQDNDMVTLAELGEITAGQGASGLSLGSRSSRRVRKTVRELGRLDTLNIRQEGELRSYGFKTDAANYKAQAGLDRMSSRNSLLQGWIGGASSLIGGAAKIRNSRRYAPSRSDYE